METDKQRCPLRLAAIGLALCVASPLTAHAAPSATGGAQPSAEARAQARAKARPDIEARRLDAEREARKTLDADAIAAIAETETAIKAIDAGNTGEALAAIERATGKIDIIVARNPATALIPVRLEVEAIDVAPTDPQLIKTLTDAAEQAVQETDYPAARTVLERLISEIRVRTYNIPLGSYPAALKEAARLLDAGRIPEANLVLVTALNTLVVVDGVTPLPVAVAQAGVEEAAKLREKDKAAAERLLATAKSELERAKLLGYAAKDPEYAALNGAITDLEKQLRGNTDTASAFTKLTDRIASFFKRQSASETRAEVSRR